MIFKFSVKSFSSNFSIYILLGHLEVLKVLLTCTDTPNIPNDNGRTPLMLAKFQTRKCHGEIIEILKKYPEVGFV